MPPDPVTQSALPLKPWSDSRTRRLPGVNPLAWEDWLMVDEAFAGQMAEKERLLAARRSEVFAEGAGEAAAELLALMLRHLGPGYAVGPEAVRRPDGREVGLGAASPLETAARLVQQDICIMEKRGAEHVLTAAALCFPANWKLADKLGRPMTAIHAPVAHYDAALARRVQRIFDAMRPEQPLWRMNHLLYRDPDLFQPQRLRPATRETGRFVRCERQSLVKLPQSGAIVFGIHTIVVPVARLSSAEREEFFAHAKVPYRQ